MKNANGNVIKNITLSPNIDDNIKEIIGQMGESFDLINKNIELKSENYKRTLRVSFFLINGLADQMLVNETIIENIIKNYKFISNYINEKDVIGAFSDYIVTMSEVKISNNFIDLFRFLLSGDTILLIDGQDKFFYIGTRKYPERAVDESKTQISIMGPKDSFTESIVTNTALIRRKLKNPNLWIKSLIIGEKTNTLVAYCYLKGVADEEVVNEVHSRLEKMEVEGIIDTSYIAAALKETDGSLFPNIQFNERPDAVVAHLLEGRVVIIMDGSPFALIVPTVFIQFLQATEDYYKKSTITTFFRSIRVMAFAFAIFLPSIYIMLTIFHSELLPYPLLVKIAAQREGLPFPSWVEAITLCLLYDLLREASLRMPAALGNTISIVGALVLGDAAIQAGVMSPIMLIVVSVTAISTLCIPNYNLQITAIVLKYVFLIAATFLGLFGIMLGVYTILIHMTSLRSFGVNYIAPYTDKNTPGEYDFIMRKPLDKVMNRQGNFTSKFPN